jgi:hypothetical protein
VVLLPRRSTGRYGLLGIAVPAIALGIGVLILDVVAAGPRAIALLAIVATPVLAAARPRRAPVALALWLVAWLAHGLLAQGAAVALIALAAVAVAEIASMLAPSWSLAIGLVMLAAVDIALVWGTRDVQPATRALHHAAIPVAVGHQLPRLQDATFGSATMGWLDLVAPALLGVIARERLRAAVATGLAGGVWGLLLFITPTIPATVPTLAGLVVGRL